MSLAIFRDTPGQGNPAGLTAGGSLQSVTSGVHVLSGIKEHSKANSHLKAGLERLGVHCGEIPRNTGRGHACGHCSFGCASGEKRDTTATFLVDAVRSGAKILTGERSGVFSLPLMNRL